MILPGIGKWLIPVEVFDGWSYDPVIVQVFVQQVIMDRVVYYDRFCLDDLRMRRRHLERLVYLSQIAGNRSALIGAQRELDSIRIREDWTARRLHQLERRVTDLGGKHKDFANRLPKGTNLFQNISGSFNSPGNLAVVNGFRNKVKNNYNFQTELAGIAGSEVHNLRTMVGRERDVKTRMALNNELLKIRNGINKGMLPINANQPELRQVVGQLSKEHNPAHVDQLQKQLTKLAGPEIPKATDLMTQANFSALQQQIARYPNPAVQKQLEQQVTDLRRSVDESRKVESNFGQIERLTSEAAGTQDAQKRQRLLDEISTLTKQIPSSAPGSLPLMQRIQGLEFQLSLEKDKKQREMLQKQIEEQRLQHNQMFLQHEQQRLGTRKDSSWSKNNFTKKTKSYECSKGLSSSARRNCAGDAGGTSQAGGPATTDG